MNKLRFIFLLLLVGVYYGYTEMKKTYKKIPSSQSAQSVQSKDVNDLESLLKARSEAQSMETFYNIVVDRFYDGDRDNNDPKFVDLYNPTGLHGGDLEGVEKKLEYIKSLGVTSIVLSNVMSQYKEPITFSDSTGEQYKSYPFLGARPNHISKVDPLYGDMGDLEDLVSRAHDLGLKVFLNLNIVEIYNDSELLKREDASEIFDLKAAPCTKWTNEEIVSCVNKKQVRFNHNSDAAQTFLIDEIKKIQQKTNLDGMVLLQSDYMPEKFIKSLNNSIMGDFSMKNFSLIFTEKLSGFPFHQDLFQGNASGFIENNALTFEMVGYVNGNIKKDFFEDLYLKYSLSKMNKFNVSKFNARDTRTIAELYNKDEVKMIKHAALWAFTGMNLIFNYGEEIGIEHGRFPTWFSDMSWEGSSDFPKFNTVFSRMLKNRHATKNFSQARVYKVYDQDGLIIYLKVFDKKIVAVLAENTTANDKVHFFKLKSDLQAESGKDAVSNSIVEHVDNGITLTVDANSVQFITF